MNRQPIVVPKNGDTAAYLRLSKDDENQGPSNSIVNQKKLLEDHAKLLGLKSLRFYTDDGESGRFFDRPAYTQLLDDIEAGKISVLMVKDTSRLGRDHLRVGLFLEMLRAKGVRLIAPGDGYDSDEGEDDFLPFKNIFHEWYVKDTSRKIKHILHGKGNSGKHMTNAAIYGYKKSASDKNDWLVDDESASIVRRIFQMTIAGKGPYQIARSLTDEKILRPTAYIAIRDGRDIPKPSERYNWSGKSVQDILDKPEYMGHTVNFRTYKDSYKDRNCKYRPKEEWKVFEDTQPAIIDAETWQAAQKCRKVKRRPNTSGEANPMTGLVYCGDCGGRLYNHRGGIQTEKYDSHDSYACCQYSKYPPKCTMHYIKTSTLNTLALEAIRTVSGFVRENEDEFIQLVREAHDLQSEEAVKLQQKQLSQHQKRHKELDSLIKQLYEDKVSGALTAKRFELLSGEYETEQECLEGQIAEMQAAASAYDEDSGNTGRFINMVRRYTEISELTATILNEYIEKIVVFEADRSSGRREQRVDIYFTFIGRIDIPGQFDSEPFDKDEHRKAQFRAYYYRNREKLLAGKSEQRKAEKAAKLAAQPVKTPEELASEEEARRERKRAYQRKYQKEWQRKRRGEKQSAQQPEQSAETIAPNNMAASVSPVAAACG